MSIDKIIEGLEPAHRVPPPGEGTRGLLAEIMAMPREDAAGTAHTAPGAPTGAAGAGAGRRHRFLRGRIAVPLVAALTAAVLIAGWFLPGTSRIGPSPAAALDIKREGGYYIVTVKDAFADPERYEAQLHDLGIDIGLTVIPVSPSLEGKIFPPFDMRTNGLSPEEILRRGDLIAPIESPGPCAFDRTCTIGLRIPVGYKPYRDPRLNKAPTIAAGRKGRPGEPYQGFGQLSNPGEPLACVDFVNQPVSKVTALLRERHVTVGFAVPLKGTRSSVPGDWFVHEGWLTEQGKALVVADATRRPGGPFSMSKACPKGS